MPYFYCCCKDNVTASLANGIVLAILSLVSIAGCNATSIASLNSASIGSGVIGALIQCFSIFGAYKRNRTLILVWMIFAILQCVFSAIMGLFGILLYAGALASIGGFDIDGASAYLVVFSVCLFIVFLFEVWTIIVAKRAREEIARESQRPRERHL